MAGLENQVLYAKNVNFNHLAPPPHLGIVTADGQLLIGSTTDPNNQIVANTLTAGTGISIANGPGSITISNTGSMTDLHTARFIVSAGGTADGANYTTIALALAAAGAGPATIFLQPGTYTENFTLPANINLAAYICDAETPNVSIVGTITCTDAGTRSISGIRLTASGANYLVVSGSAATIVKLVNCYLNCSDNTGISFTSTGAGTQIWILGCNGTLGTTGITHWVMTSTGLMNIFNSRLFSGSATSTPSSTSSGPIVIHNCSFNFPLSTSSTGNYDLRYVLISCNNQNATAITTAGTGSSTASFCDLLSGTASAVSIGAGTTLRLEQCAVNSSNTNAITGAGTVVYGNVAFGNTSVINTTTQTALYSNLGKWKASGQPAFLAFNSATESDVTGDGVTVPIDFDSEVFDVDSNFSADTYTAPVTSKVHLDAVLLLQQVAAANTCQFDIVTSNRTYKLGNTGTSFTGNMPMALSILADMDAADTAFAQVTVSGGARTVDVYGGADMRTYFSGIQLA